MVDLHCHILPGIDDGAQDIYDTLEMALIAVNSGVKAVVATPHCNIPGVVDNYYNSAFRDVLQKVRKALSDERVPLKILSGMEVFVTYDLPDLIKAGKVLTINQSDYLLMEFDFGEEPDFIELMAKRVQNLGKKPLIAHPERYECIKDNPEFAHRLHRNGCLLQANKGSFLGRYGTRSQSVAEYFAKENLLTAVASDAHSPQKRTPYMMEAFHTVEKLCDANELFSVNPRKICLNQPL